MSIRHSHTSRAPTEVDKLVGEKIRLLRHDHDYTLSELGEALGISHQQLQKYETGVNRLSAGMLFNLANLFQVSVGELFEIPTKGNSSDNDPLEKARHECKAVIDRTKSTDVLHTMTRVLKAINPK